MPYTLGIDVGVSGMAAAISRLDGSRWAAARPIGSVSSESSTPMIARIGDDGDQLGAHAYAVHDLMADRIAGLVAEIAAENGPAAQLTVTHPACWGPYRTDLLHQALRAAGVANVSLVAEPVAAAVGVGVATRHRVDTGGLVAVYDIGGSSVTASVVRSSASGGFELVGRAETAEHPAGADFDDVLFTLVAGDQTDISWDSMAQLRRDCVAGKQALSTQPEVTIPPGRTRVTRTEFEDAILPVLNQGVDVLLCVVTAAGTTTDQLMAIALVGGSARIPLVRRVLGDRLRRPVLVDEAPETTTAAGAATIATWAVPAPTDRSSVNGSSAVGETVVMAKLTEETEILFPCEDPDLVPQPETDSVPEVLAPDPVPQWPPVEVAAPDRTTPRPVRRRRRREPVTLRGAVIGAMTATLLIVAAWLVQQYLSATPAEPPPVARTVQVSPSAGGR